MRLSQMRFHSELMKSGCKRHARANARMAFGLALFLVSSTAWAGDPWKDKSYKEWTMEEVEKIISDSPWAKTVNIEAPWIKGRAHYLTNMQLGCGGRPDLSKPMKTPPQMAVGPLTDSIVTYQVIWQSSYTIRAARVRLAVLCKRTDPHQGDELLEQEPEQYYITVSAPDMSPFDGMDEDSLLKNTFLSIKRKNARISATAVRIMRGMDQRTVFSLTFKFPKKAENGQPVIAPDEKEIEFVSQSGKTIVKARFQPSKMISKNRTDL